jgi:hypothetical protein
VAIVWHADDGTTRAADTTRARHPRRAPPDPRPFPGQAARWAVDEKDWLPVAEHWLQSSSEACSVGLWSGLTGWERPRGCCSPSLFVGLQFALFVGGVSYRKECLKQDAATVKTDWTFTWFAPIPYVFRPSEPGCIVHTGTRVALDSFGIAKFEPTTPELIASKYAATASNENAAYLGQVKVTLVAMQKASQTSLTFTQAFAIINRTEQRIAALTPPPRYVGLHNRLLTVLRDAEGHGHAAQDAIRAGNGAALARARRHAQIDNARMRAVFQEVNREVAAL